MLTKLTLDRFKNFNHAELVLGPVTTVIGTNASGKSNLRDAFRFLHGIGRGYTLAEIMGEKYGEGGEIQWKGIRGGTREATYLQAESFQLTLEYEVHVNEKTFHNVYSLKVIPGINGFSPKRAGESLDIADMVLFDSFNSRKKSLWGQSDVTDFSTKSPILNQIGSQLFQQLESERKKSGSEHEETILQLIYQLISMLHSMRFFDFSPHAMRIPSLPGQMVLGDRGENLSSVLQAICEDSQRQKTLLEWIRELTPMDVCDLEFVADQTGKILLTLIEENGNRTSAYSASDGTLRFLAIIAALLGPKPAKLIFFEEIENGIHPSRLHLLLQLMEHKASEGEIQIINTTHSPQFLRFLSQQSREYASLTYRLSEAPEGRITRIFDIPEARRLSEEQDIAELHESSWFEHAMFFSEDVEEES